MSASEQPNEPLWAAAKARKHGDILREVALALDAIERERVTKPFERLTEADLEAEQLRLEEMLRLGTMTVADFQRLREIDHFLEGMRWRRHYGPSRELRESLDE